MKSKRMAAAVILTLIGCICLGFVIGSYITEKRVREEHSFHFERDCEVQRFHIEEGYIELSGNDDTLTITISSKGE